MCPLFNHMVHDCVFSAQADLLFVELCICLLTHEHFKQGILLLCGDLFIAKMADVFAEIKHLIFL